MVPQQGTFGVGRDFFGEEVGENSSFSWARLHVEPPAAVYGVGSGDDGGGDILQCFK
jgi:hypothetical protein